MKRKLDLATEVGYGPIPGADHTRPTVHWKLTPGIAWQFSGGKYILVEVPAKFAAKCEYTFNIVFVQDRSVVCFKGPDGKEYLQPIAPLRTSIKKRGKSKASFHEARGVAPSAPGAEGEVLKGRR